MCGKKKKHNFFLSLFLIASRVRDADALLARGRSKNTIFSTTRPFLSLSLYIRLVSVEKRHFLSVSNKRKKRMIVASCVSFNRTAIAGLHRRRSTLSSSSIASSPLPSSSSPALSFSRKSTIITVTRRAFGGGSGSDSDGWIEKIKQGALEKKERERLTERKREKNSSKQILSPLTHLPLSLRLFFPLCRCYSSTQTF